MRKLATIEPHAIAFDDATQVQHRDWDAELNWTNRQSQPSDTPPIEGSLVQLKKTIGASDKPSTVAAPDQVPSVLKLKGPTIEQLQALQTKAMVTQKFLQGSGGAIDRLPYTHAAAIGPNWIYFNNGYLVGCSTPGGATATFASEEERKMMANAIFTFIKRHHDIKNPPPEFHDFMRVYFNRTY